MGNPLDLSHIDTTVIIAHTIVFVAGIFGNTLVVIVVLRHSRMKTVANYFILNLAVADEAFLLTLPFKTYTTYTGDWPFGLAICKLVLIASEVNRFTSIFTIAVLSADRFFAISYPTKSLNYRTTKKASLTCIFIWILSIAIVTPFWIYGEIMPAYQGGRDCGIKWPVDKRLEYFQFWTWFQFVLGFLIPLFVIAIFCFAMLKNMLMTVVPRIVSGSRRNNNRIAIILFIVTVTFAVCWIPHHVVEFDSLFKQIEIADVYARNMTYNISEKEATAFITLATAAQIMVAISSCINPFIYGLRSENFKRLFKSAICKCRISQLEIDSNDAGPRHRLQVSPEQNLQDAAMALTPESRPVNEHNIPPAVSELGAKLLIVEPKNSMILVQSATTHFDGNNSD